MMHAYWRNSLYLSWPGNDPTIICIRHYTIIWLPNSIYILSITCWLWIILYSNTTSFFCFVNKRVIYRLGIISFAHAPVHLTDLPVINVHVDELSSARIWQHKLCATLSANVNINYCLPIKVYYHICTLRHIRIKIIHGSQNVFWV
jgi:hypothetical protein